jgi:hypothetical protein
MSMMLWIREHAHHLLAAATWELCEVDKRASETGLGLGKRGKAEVWEAWRSEGVEEEWRFQIKETQWSERTE